MEERKKKKEKERKKKKERKKDQSLSRLRLTTTTTTIIILVVTNRQSHDDQTDCSIIGDYYYCTLHVATSLCLCLSLFEEGIPTFWSLFSKTERHT